MRTAATKTRYQLAGGGSGIHATCSENPSQFNNINPPLPSLDLRHPAMRYSQFRRQIALRKPRRLAYRAQLRPQCLVFLRMDRFLHCSDYRSVLRCSQIRSTMYDALRSRAGEWCERHFGIAFQSSLCIRSNNGVDSTDGCNNSTASRNALEWL